MPRKKVLFQTNAPWLRTGLSQNGRVLMNWLARRGKYDLVYYCTQAGQNDPNLSRLPYKAYGSIPADPNWAQACRGDFGCVRDVHYGGRFIHDIVKAEQPQIYVCSDDAWAMPSHYFQSDWFKKINSVPHITVDSVPVAPLAYEQAASTPYFLSWAKFAVDEMKRAQPKTCANVDFIYGASDTEKFRPVSPSERAELRRMVGLDPKDTIFLQLSRNQLRKSFLSTMQAFAEFKRANPGAHAKLLLHTDWSGAAASQGWDLPRHREYLGLKKEDVLATYHCRNCRRWEVKPYSGEDQDCRFCGALKAQVTPNGFQDGVEEDDLYQVFGLADACVSSFSSGGLEFFSVNSLLCGLPLACTDYSCGVDFCQQPFVHTIKWHPYHEVQSNFIKASNDVPSIVAFMAKVHSLSLDERRAWGAQGREWAERTFSVDAVGAKWETLFDSMPPKDWSTITLGYTPKNANAPMPEIADAAKWVTSLYQQILLVEPDPDGLKHRLAQLQSGITRDAIYRFFLGRADADNAQHAPPMDFASLFDGKTDDPARRKRLLYVMRESGGDIFISTALFPGLKRLYPDADLYVACEPKFAEILAGNEHIHKVLPYIPIMDHELAMQQYVDYYYWPAVSTQVRLNYLLRERVGLDLSTPKEVAA